MLEDCVSVHSIWVESHIQMADSTSHLKQPLKFLPFPCFRFLRLAECSLLELAARFYSDTSLGQPTHQ